MRHVQVRSLRRTTLIPHALLDGVFLSQLSRYSGAHRGMTHVWGPRVVPVGRNKFCQPAPVRYRSQSYLNCVRGESHHMFPFVRRVESAAYSRP